MKVTFPISLTIIFCLVTIATGFQWQRQDMGIREKIINFVATQKASGYIFVGSDRSVYLSSDGAKTWKNVLNIRSGPREINFIAFNPSDQNNIFVGTQNGLYESKDLGRTWIKTFSGMLEFKQDALSILFVNRKIYLGTRAGLFFSTDKGLTWQIQDGQLSNLIIKSMACDPMDKNIIYFATSRGIYKTEDNFASLKRVFVSLLKDKEIQDDQETYEGLEETEININQILVDPQNPSDIYSATADGIFFSTDKGLTWARMNSEGLATKHINWLLKDKDRLFAATDKGIFEFRIRYWENIYKGLSTQKINCLDINNYGNLLAATENGLFKLDIDGNTASNLAMSATSNLAMSATSNLAMSAKGILSNFKYEPTILEIQKVAINYAEVSNEKIKAWRRQAKVKALMPAFTLDYDKTVTTSLGSTYDRVQTGPRDWGMSLKWDVSELVWNNDQTSIDSRSRLMVQLRDDILNEITRLYFERRRLQAQILMASAKGETTNIDDELRLQELTASIDALTGGYLSRCLEERLKK